MTSKWVPGKITGRDIDTTHQCPECEHYWRDHIGPVINWERHCGIPTTDPLVNWCQCRVDLHKYPQALWDRVSGWNEPLVDMTRQCKRCPHVLAQHVFRAETDACYEYKCAVPGCTCPDLWLLKTTGEQVEHLFMDEVDDPVNRPSHYTSHPSGVECITITEHYNFCLGNAIKYIWRAGLKDTDALEDLEKARWYLDREIARRKGSKAGVQTQDTRKDSVQGGS